MRAKKLIAGMSAAALMSMTVSASIPAFADDSVPYSEQEITAHAYSEDNITPITTRFFTDLPNIPYVRLTDYYKVLTGKELGMQTDGSEFVFTNPLSEQAVINTDSDVLTSDDFFAFTNLLYLRKEGLENISYDGMPFLNIKEILHDKAAEPTEIDFSSYGIDLRSDGEELWLPFSTAADLFTTIALFNGVYDGSEYFFTDATTSYTTDQTANSDSFISNTVERYFKDGKREPDAARLSYNELCLLMDYFYGFPGSAALNDDLVEYGSFDKMLTALDEKYSSDKEYSLKGLLLSEDLKDYVAGMYLLHMLLFDGGHTTMWYGINNTFQACGLSADDLTVLANGTGYPLADAFSKVLDSQTIYQIMPEVRKAQWGEEKYHKYGSTAVFAFDTFMLDFEGWKAFYNGTGDRPDDELGLLLDALKQADEDPEVRNFVFDLTCNTGGSSDPAVFIMNIICGLDRLNIYNTGSDQIITTVFDVDTNLDGVFDEKDHEKQYDLNFGVLESRFAFSCGNLFPCLAKDNGVPLFGDRSGGGSCSIYHCLSAEGQLFVLSSNMRFADKNGNNIDSGIEPDYPMLGEDAEGNPDYTTLFDLEYIDKTMNELFPEEEENSEPDESTPDSSEPEDSSEPDESTPDTSEPDESSVPEAGKPDDKGGNPNTGAAAGFAVIAVIAAAGIVARKRS